MKVPRWDGRDPESPSRGCSSASQCPASPTASHIPHCSSASRRVPHPPLHPPGSCIPHHSSASHSVLHPPPHPASPTAPQHPTGSRIPHQHPAASQRILHPPPRCAHAAAPHTEPLHPQHTQTHTHIHTQRVKPAASPNNCGAFVSLSQLADSYRAKHNSLTLREY